MPSPPLNSVGTPAPANAYNFRNIDPFAAPPSSLTDKTATELLFASPTFGERISSPGGFVPIRPQADFVTIRRPAPVGGEFGFFVNNAATIEIKVRPLTTGLGTLDSSPADIAKQLDEVAGRMNQENLKAYGTGTAGLRDKAVDAGYFRSPAHLAWADAAEARTGGRIPAEWWIRNDPFGGTAGNGPDVKPGGIYPGVISRIAFAHDTDWTLGRHFKAGPLSALYTSKASPTDMGFYGLAPGNIVNPNLSADQLYTRPTGRDDWKVDYWRTGS